MELFRSPPGRPQRRTQMTPFVFRLFLPSETRELFFFEREFPLELLAPLFFFRSSCLFTKMSLFREGGLFFPNPTYPLPLHLFHFSRNVDPFFTQPGVPIWCTFKSSCLTQTALFLFLVGTPLGPFAWSGIFTPFF